MSKQERSSSTATLGAGDAVPQVLFRLCNAEGWLERSSADVVAGRTVVAFALPRAFTPTCTGSQVPGHDAHATEFNAPALLRWCASR